MSSKDRIQSEIDQGEAWLERVMEDHLLDDFIGDELPRVKHRVHIELGEQYLASIASQFEPTPPPHLADRIKRQLSAISYQPAAQPTVGAAHHFLLRWLRRTVATAAAIGIVVFASSRVGQSPSTKSPSTKLPSTKLPSTKSPLPITSPTAFVSAFDILLASLKVAPGQADVELMQAQQEIDQLEAALTAPPNIIANEDGLLENLNNDLDQLMAEIERNS